MRVFLLLTVLTLLTSFSEAAPQKKSPDHRSSAAGTDELVLEAPAKLRAAEPSRAPPPKPEPPSADELCAKEKAATEEASNAVQNCGAKCNSGKALLDFQHAREAYEACYEKAQKK